MVHLSTMLVSVDWLLVQTQPSINKLTGYFTYNQLVKDNVQDKTKNIFVFFSFS